MLILSDFRDYYDSALAHGVDKTIVYHRRKNTDTISSEVLSQVLSEQEIEAYYFLRNNTPATPQLVVVAGKAYIRIRFADSYNNVSNHYNIESISQAKQVKNIYKNGGKFEGSFLSKGSTIEQLMSAAQKLFHIHGRDVTDFAIKHNIVVAIVIERDEYKPGCGYAKETTIKHNPRLQNIEAFKIVDSYTAMQDIMMWISGVIGSPAGEMIEVSDKDKVVAKGFDKVYGFRTRPKRRIKNV